MRLAYWKSGRANFGDDMNLWFWDRILPGWHAWRDDSEFLFGIGTILNETSLSRPGRCLILGSGTGYSGVRPATAYPRADFRFVRGPLTAERLGLPPEMGISDPAILTPQILEPGPAHGSVLFVPHHATAAIGLPWDRWCASAGVEFLSPSGESEATVQRIAGARLVIAESMHAAIIADAYRVPWVAVQFSGGFNEFKWRDWARGLDIEFTSIAHPARVARLVKSLMALRKGRSPASASPPAARPGSPPSGSVPPSPGPNAATEGSGTEPASSWMLQALGMPLGLAFRAVLGQAMRQAPSLSADTALAGKQRAIRDVLERTAAEFGERPLS